MVEFVDFGFEPNETSYPLNDPDKRASLIGAFETVFTGENSPYNENWDYETIDGFLDWTEKQDHEGTLAIEDGRVVGFSWGYRVESDEVDIEGKFPEGVEEAGFDIYDDSTFMLDEVGVLPGKYRGIGLGLQVEARTLRKASERADIDRAMQRTQLSTDNIPKLSLDDKLGFQPILDNDQDVVVQEVDYVGKSGSDWRIYLQSEL